MFLLDTVVISELRKRRPSTEVVSWLKARKETELFVSVITLGEIQRGIAAKRVDDAAFAAELQHWLDALPRRYGDRVLPVTAAIARRWGELSWRAGRGDADLVIAATALEHQLTVATRNTRHFEPLGVPVFNPFATS